MGIARNHCPNADARAEGRRALAFGRVEDLELRPLLEKWPKALLSDVVP